MEKSFRAYKIINTVSGGAYIGATTRTLAARWQAHVSKARCGLKTVLADAIRKYGEAAFVIEHMASARTHSDLFAVEQFLIDQERTLVRFGGYNSSIRGVAKSADHRAKLALSRLGTKASAETKAKLSAMRAGKSHSPEWVRRQAETIRGRPKSLEHRAKLSAAKTGQKASEETKAKLSAQRKGRKLNLTPEQRAERSARASARRHSAEARAKISAARRERERKRAEQC
jgi:group I intron endonuclease